MLLKRPLDVALPRIEKTVNGKNATDKGAFFCRDELTLTVRLDRAFGAAAVVLRLVPDGEQARDLPLRFVTREGGEELYRITLSLSALCGEAGEGLFYYELLFLRGADTLFTDTKDNVTYTLSPRSAGRFRLLVSENSFDTPQWFRGRTMYHVFVDRFAPRGGERPDGAVYHENWHEEIEQFGAYPGAPVKNNEFFGGTLWGVADKLDYLKGLGVGVIYLSPIFKAASNHKYDTGDYETVDPQFGGMEALEHLIAEAKKRNMGVMLDGVFNHTGDDSRYFNRYGSYPEKGAYQSTLSPYTAWYYFRKFPDVYESWWGIEILPKLRLVNPELHRYLVGKGGVIEKYTRAGVMGWRLDVADELPDAFLDDLRCRVKEATGGEGVVLGEVWENAADKIAYGRRRRYFRGRQLDSVMNYPLRRGIISFVKEGDASALTSVLRELWGSYPTSVCHSLMNVLSTHDTERILTVLGGEPDDGRFSNAQLRVMRMTERERRVAKDRLKMAAALQYTVFGVPSLFYGDEAGMEGYHDPFCRRPFPWGREDAELLAFYRRLGRIREKNTALWDGEFSILAESENALAYERKNSKNRIVVAVNNGDQPFDVSLDAEATELLCGRVAEKGTVRLEKGEIRIWRVKHASTRVRKADQK
ncbi:MAG: glycoside hydrolase family 13 protein [Ruminococcaceae bacterium]|nr:glycoside hydrolase family 13 protein [Oscillospiraceae bacterium]